MDALRAAPSSTPATGPGALPPAQLAKAALRRLAQEQREPTPENYNNAYRQEAGLPPGPVGSAMPERGLRLLDRLAGKAFDPAAGGHGQQIGQAARKGQWDEAERLLAEPDQGGARLADLIGRLTRGMERGGKHWTLARRKESLQRLLSGSRGDVARLQQRLSQLLGSWENDTPEAQDPGAAVLEAPAEAAALPELLVTAPPLAESVANTAHPDTALLAAPAEAPPGDRFAANWGRVITSLGGSVQQALPPQEPEQLARLIARATERLQQQGAEPELVEELQALCQRADRVLAHRHRLVEQLGELCQELTASLTDLAEDDSWARGQCEAMQQRIDEGLSARGVKSVAELLRVTRARQLELRHEREHARDALKSLIQHMIGELGSLGMETGRFHDSVGRYAEVIQNADSLESLAGVVRDMVEDSRAVQAVVGQAQQRLRQEHSRATELTQKVQELEGELRRLSNEVSTDQLTQIANRRGLLQAFEAERSRLERGGGELSIGLLDIDNFKRLNDELGHGAGDEALKSLARVVSQALRPTDQVARYGGEEFVVLLPDTSVEEGQQILTRLQRSLSGGLFMHEQKRVFVTFSAGISAYRLGEAIEATLERADQALYEAKRIGKNRTCTG